MADNEVTALNASNSTVTIRSTDVGAGVQGMMSIPANTSGTALFGQAAMATSIPVVIASDQSSITAVISGTVTAVVAGNIASGSADSGNPVKLGAVGHTAAPTAVADGQRVNLIADKVGKLIAVGGIRQLMATQTSSLTTAAETVIVNALNATTFADMYGLVLANTGATAAAVSIRYGVASSVALSFYVPAGDTRGFMLPVDSAIAGSLSTANLSWTAQASLTTTISATTFYVKNI